MNRYWITVATFAAGLCLDIDRRPKPQGMRPPRPGRGDTTKTYPTSGDVIRKGKRR